MNMQHSRAGFTLVQLLVCIGIILLLMALLLPAISRVRAHARLAICSANLNQVSAAFTHWGYDKGLLLPEADRWTSVVRSSASGVNEILFCPEAPAQEGNDPLAMLWFGTWRKPMNADPQGSRNNANNDWRIVGQAGASPFTIQINYMPPGRGPNSENLIVAVLVFTEISPGAWQVYVEVAHPQYRTDIMSDDGRRFRDVQPGEVYGLFHAMAPTNYGYNGLAEGVRDRRPRSALVMDSHKVVLDAQDVSNMLKLEPQLAPRHLGKVNVLYSDGSVELTPIDALDPQQGLFLVKR